MSDNQPKPASSNNEPGPQRPEPEVLPRAQRRRFSAAYKLRIVEEADRCTERGQVGALLRREGLYSSQLAAWRAQRTAGQLAGLAGQPRGRKTQSATVEVARLQRENERLRARLEQAQLIITVQKKLSQLLGLPADETENDESNS